MLAAVIFFYGSIVIIGAAAGFIVAYTITKGSE